MARTKGSPNKAKPDEAFFTELSIEERIQVIASMIVDRIYEDMDSGLELLHSLREFSNG